MCTVPSYLHLWRYWPMRPTTPRDSKPHSGLRSTEDKYRWHKKTGTFEKPNKNWINPRKKIIDRNWTITTCLLRDCNPYYQCLKITSCRWRPPPRMHSFTATTHFKISRSFVSPCVRRMLCRMRQSRILQSMQHTQGDTKERELLKCVVAVKECIRGGGRHLQDVIFKLDNLDYCLLKGKL